MRSQTLDILRTAAVLLVIGRHLTPPPSELNTPWRILAEAWRRGGWVGVDSFFVLSGFLVAGLLFKEQQRYGSLRVKRFLVRRGFKIYPAFYVMLAVTVAVRWLMGKDVPLGNLLREIFFIQNYGPGLHGHTWSLAVEEHFYLLLALVLALGLAWHKRRGATPDTTTEHTPFYWLPTFFFIIAAACLGLRWRVHETTPFFTYATHLTPTHLRIDSLAFGVLLSYFYHYWPTAWQDFTTRYRWPLTAVGLASLAPVFVWPIEHTAWLSHIGFTLVYLGSGALVSAWADYPLTANWAVRVLSSIGVNSYSIYLWHASIMTWFAVGLRGHLGWTAYALASVTGALLFGIVMAQVVETPVLRLRDRLFPSRSQP